jgi:hypothetical protein
MKNLVLAVILIFTFNTNGQEITVFVESLTYNFYEDQKRISVKDVRKLVKTDSIAAMHWKRMENKNILVNVSLALDLAFIIGVGTNNIKSDHYKVLGPAFVLSSFGGVFLSISRQKSLRKAILRYNSLFDQPLEKKEFTSYMEIKPVLIRADQRITNSSTGLGISFNW